MRDGRVREEGVKTELVRVSDELREFHSYVTWPVFPLFFRRVLGL